MIRSLITDTGDAIEQAVVLIGKAILGLAALAVGLTVVLVVFALAFAPAIALLAGAWWLIWGRG